MPRAQNQYGRRIHKTAYEVISIANVPLEVTNGKCSEFLPWKAKFW